MLSHPHRLIPVGEGAGDGLIATNILTANAAGKTCRVWINTREVTRLEDHIAYVNTPTEGGGHVERIALEVATKRRVRASWIMDPSIRRHEVSHARHEVMYRLATEIVDSRGHPTWSTPRIAQALGLENHTSVIYGIKAHKRREGIA